MAGKAPDLREAQMHLGSVIDLLTLLSLQSVAGLVAGDARAEEELEEYRKWVQNLSAMIKLDDDHMNPRWNRTYGEGGTKWDGPLQDGQGRGGIPYFCPSGWARFSLKICPDDEFKSKYASWGNLYHGTSSKHVGSILLSGFRGSQGLCFCGKEDHAVYMSPSVEYSGHPRYASIEYNPETRKFMQVVLQCRVNPAAVWKKCGETMRCKEFGLVVDPNIPNGEVEWLFKPNHVEASTGHRYVKDAIVCTGIMLRLTDVHPLDMQYWWTTNQKYAEHWQIDYPKVDPHQSISNRDGWFPVVETDIEEFGGFTGNCLGSTFRVAGVRRRIGKSWLSPHPFAKGGMRLAYYLFTEEGVYVVKSYNSEMRKHIRDALSITEEQAVAKEVHTYVVAREFASRFFNSLGNSLKKECTIDLVKPLVFRLREEGGRTRYMFGERYIEGNFIKWNNNTGEVNLDKAATEKGMHFLASCFCHYTYAMSEGRLMVVDIQGWYKPGAVIFTDPQIHTRSFAGGAKDRTENVLYRRFSMGNLGKTGMINFFATHQCHELCKHLPGLQHVCGSQGAERRVDPEACPFCTDLQHCSCCQNLVRGSRVTVQGLRSHAHLNEQAGVCEEWDSARGRWRVRVGDQVVAVRPENLRIPRAACAVM